MQNFKVRLFALLFAFFPCTAFADDPLLIFMLPDRTETYDIERLRSFEAVAVSTTTIWTEGVQDFEGVRLRTLLDDADVSGGTLRATAINDYSVDIPVEDAVPDGPIIAYSRNGNLMSIRDKGPLWLVYPFDSDPMYQTEMIYSRSIWQLDRLELME